MSATLAHIALVVRDYDEAIAWFVERLGFILVEDREVPEQAKRWVLVAPPGGGTSILLARATTPEQAACIGNQAGGRVFAFLATDDFARDHARYVAAGVRFVRGPSDEPYGRVAVFEDLYGNRWDLIEYAAPARARAAG
jgi:catechol 2,3-dioxygenase-like lactoylglutathione lyase family enzyme